ncbi:cation transporting ATPase C-terminal domain-containing protein, partial [Mycolicibacterium elephantis]
AVAVGAMAQIAVVHLPPLQAAFGTTGLDLAHWAAAIAMASAVLWFDEVRKVILRLSGRVLS